jgi:rubrerythrin
MASEGAGGSGRDAWGPGTVEFNCHGCGVRFTGDAAGPGVCPRCGAIGGHERLGRPEDPSQ